MKSTVFGEQYCQFLKSEILAYQYVQYEEYEVYLSCIYLENVLISGL